MKRAGLMLAGAILCGASVVHAEDPQGYAPDNTGVNVRDRQERAVTPQKQSNQKSDVEITRNIRKELMANRELSTNAKNVKVVTQGGKVVLRGPVNSADEKQSVEQLAATVAGETNVINRLEITTRQ